MDATLDVDCLNFAVVGGNVGLAMSLVLQNLGTIDVLVPEDTLVHHHELAVEAGVDL